MPASPGPEQGRRARRRLNCGHEGWLDASCRGEHQGNSTPIRDGRDVVQQPVEGAKRRSFYGWVFPCKTKGTTGVDAGLSRAYRVLSEQIGLDFACATLRRLAR